MQTANVKARPHVIYLIIKQMRCRQWTKNTLLFAALIFSPSVYSMSLFLDVFLGFILFSLVSSCVYIVNDYMDIEADRQHPTKRFRPMASGELPAKNTLFFGGLLFFVCMTIASYMSNSFAILLLLYFIVNIAYSMVLKHIVILDVMIVASGFVLRAIGGGIVIDVHVTPWFLICTMLLSLFLAISKRRHEYILAQENSTSHRKVLKLYNKELLDQMISIVTTSTVISYALFTFTSGRTVYLMWTLPLVIYGIFRYLYLIHVEGKGGSPDKLLFEDKPIFFTVVLYGVSVMLILYLFE